jgi:hypothetical protein
MTSPSERVRAAVNLVSNLLMFQLNGGKIDLSLLSAADDYFALGYVFGFNDCACQLFGIKRNDTEGFAMMALSYAQLAGEEGPKIARKSMDLSQTDTAFMDGARLGGTELIAFTRSKTAPLALLRHLQKEYADWHS